MLDDVPVSDGDPNRAEVTVAAAFLGPTSGKVKPPSFLTGQLRRGQLRIDKVAKWAPQRLFGSTNAIPR